MLKYKNKILPNTEDISIDFKGRIYNVKTNETIKTRIYRGREFYKDYKVYILQVSTNSNAYFEGCHVHHCDENPLNNAMSNLVTLSKAEHHRIHKTFLLHDETKKKISESMKGKNKGKHLSEESKQKLIDSHKGKKLSEATKLKMSEARKGEKNPMFGQKRSAETKKKISDATKGEKNHAFSLQWFNNGVENIRCKVQPEGFVSGMLKRK